MVKLLYFTSLIILVIFTVIVYSLGGRNGETGIWFNIFAELIGIIIGITYIQFLLHYMNKYKWKNADRAIQKRMLNIINQISNTVRSICELRPAVSGLSSERLEQITINEISDMTLSMIADLSLGRVTSFLKRLNIAEWASLSTAFRESSNSISEIIMLTQGNPEPSQIEPLFNIQDNIHSINSTYLTFGDLFGRDRTDLPVNEVLPENKLIGLRDTYYEHTARNLIKIIKHMKTLLGTIDHSYKLSDYE
jgi:hypothetical protein